MTDTFGEENGNAGVLTLNYLVSSLSITGSMMGGSDVGAGIDIRRSLQNEAPHVLRVFVFLAQFHFTSL